MLRSASPRADGPPTKAQLTALVHGGQGGSDAEAVLLTLPPTAPRGSAGPQSSLLRPGTSGSAVRRQAGDRVFRRRGLRQNEWL